MNYISTRTANSEKYSAAYVIKKGLASDGGLYVPESIPALKKEDIDALVEMSYTERAAYILSLFLTDYTKEELENAANAAYSAEKFGGPAAPIARVGGDYFLELWHGPTSAFKDMALQIMPRLLSLSLGKTGEEKDAYILVATSGDTGKAALEGYCDIDRVRIQVFYPVNGVSNIQKKQMASQKGNNVNVVAINGNFDDAQSGVKAIFADENAKKALEEKGLFFSSANSINWGRLAPQIVYYISAYCDLVKEEEIKYGDELDITVPTGNFGNILAAYIAKKMGLPLGKLVCASNKNDILTDFINKGVYDKRREFFTTVSPSMDILISSNLERLLWFVLGADKTRECMEKLAREGVYSLDEESMKLIREDFAGYSCSEEETKKTISELFSEYGYLCDTHTAVAANAAKQYKSEKGNKMLVVSTASAYKFAPAVLSALGEEVPSDDFDALDKLFAATKCAIPKNLANLREAEVRFTKTVEPEDMINSL
ncbi:MAG: threonine synthase [Clostridia bacterium]|nr:threonine synthase [Clostridia bacterium]MBO5914553.1 threonine synthase [Clostridia bacterium]